MVPLSESFSFLSRVNSYFLKQLLSLTYISLGDIKSVVLKVDVSLEPSASQVVSSLSNG